MVLVNNVPLPLMLLPRKPVIDPLEAESSCLFIVVNMSMKCALEEPRPCGAIFFGNDVIMSETGMQQGDNLVQSYLLFPSMTKFTNKLIDIYLVQANFNTFIYHEILQCFASQLPYHLGQNLPLLSFTPVNEIIF